jgi:cytoplasmic iron level regulating protein YaaA (DUF328/UPF0246 family)
LKVLFSCSEAKDDYSEFEALNIDSLSFRDIYHKRVEVLNKYQSMLNEYDNIELKSLFGITKESLIDEYKNVNILKDATQKAVLRYSGVGYQYLDYNTLSSDAQYFIDKNVVIFSNLFGPILAEDKIPFYKLKQGKKLDKLAIDKFYKECSQQYLDDFFADELIVDLRASSYDSFYDISDKYHLKVKFIKDSKVVSHYSKAYRGKFLRAISQKEKLKDIHHILHMNIANMNCIDVSDYGKQTLLTYEILD